MRALLSITFALAFTVGVFAQEVTDPERLFEAGQFQRVIEVAQSAGDDPGSAYLAALSYQKLRQPDDAIRLFQQLAGRPAGDPWRLVGQSATQLQAGQVAAAEQSARQAIAADPNLPQAHYQLGLVLGHTQDFGGAAAEFDAAKALDPDFAYAYYYAGLSYYRIGRIDLMASNFETFLKRAPNAPDRGEVESIMRTVRGRR
jgi:tetratricopeptide (TPR) repeat protein